MKKKKKRVRTSLRQMRRYSSDYQRVQLSADNIHSHICSHMHSHICSHICSDIRSHICSHMHSHIRSHICSQGV